MKIALVATGLGHVYRGFEQFSTGLFNLLKDDLDITLFKGAGTSSEREVVIPSLRRDGILSHIPFVRNHPGRNPLYFEGLSFLVALLPRLIREKYDLVHYSGVPFENFMHHFKNKLGLKVPFKLLFTNGCSNVGDNLFRIDYLHEITPFAAEQAAAYGIPRERIFSICSAFDAAQFEKIDDKAGLRAKYGIPQDKRVILSVAALNRHHKRTDYLIREAARLGKEYFLFLVGHVEDASLKGLAKDLLGDRVRFPEAPYESLRDIYSLADVFTIGSLEEGFCIAMVEAMAAKLPVLAHDSSHFEWLIGDKRALVDMKLEGNLAHKIEELFRPDSRLDEMINGNYERTLKRFDWTVLKPDYLNMYECIAKGIAAPKPKEESVCRG